MEFSIVIPTYCRPSDVDSNLASLFAQTEKPKEIIVFDDGELASKPVEKWQEPFKTKVVDLIYYKKNHSLLKEKAGTSFSRNLGLTLAKSEIVFIFDDDVVLEKDFCQKIMDVWRGKADSLTIGVGGVQKNCRKKTFFEKIYNKIFGLSSRLTWDVNKFGFQCWDNYCQELSQGYYLRGCLGSYRRELAKQLKFRIIGGGSGGLEDVDFFYRAKMAGFNFFVEPGAKAIHKISLSGREDSFILGRRESLNRWAIFNQDEKKSLFMKILFVWANIGWNFRSILSGQFKKAAGQFSGLLNK